jgi:hypothetical protein
MQYWVLNWINSLFGAFKLHRQMRRRQRFLACLSRAELADICYGQRDPTEYEPPEFGRQTREIGPGNNRDIRSPDITAPINSEQQSDRHSEGGIRT